MTTKRLHTAGDARRVRGQDGGLPAGAQRGLVSVVMGQRPGVGGGGHTCSDCSDNCLGLWVYHAD